MKIRNSILDNQTIVVEIENGDTGEAVDLLNIKKNGYAVFGDNVELPIAVIDGRLRNEDWFTDNHLLAIEAHELGHILTNSEKEPVAERKGIRLLDSAGYIIAANILRDRGIA